MSKFRIMFTKAILVVVLFIGSHSQLSAQSPFSVEGDPTLSNGGVFIHEYSNDVVLEPSFVAGGKIQFGLDTENLAKLGAFYLKCDLNGDGAWDFSSPKYIGDFTEANLTVNFQPVTNPGDSVVKTLRFEYYDLNLYKFSQSSVGLTLVPTADKRYGETNDFLDCYQSDNPLHNKPLLIVEGFDALNQTWPSYYYHLLWKIIKDDLLANGYDVYFLNFADGGRDLRENADVLKYALDKVNSLSGNGDNIILAGLSMGGVISRYALAKAESMGQNHHVSVFLSLDSPQRGANISPSLQDWVKVQDESVPAIQTMQTTLKSKAAKQLLLYSTYDSDKVSHLEFYGANYDFNGLNGDGFPHLCKNYAVSNGNFKATYGIDQNGAHILDLIVGPISTSVNSVDNDNGTGSKISNIQAQIDGMKHIIPGIGSVNWSLLINYNPVFIPTWSSLFIPRETPTGTNLNWNLDIIDTTVTKFDDYVVQKNPVEHHIITPETRSKILLWAEIGTKITVDQVNSSSQSVGTVYRWKGSNFVAVSKNLPMLTSKNTTEIIKADQTVISNEKYQFWKNKTTGIIEPSVKNHHEFPITEDANYLSQLKQISSASLKTTVDGFDYPAGSVQFRDPWLID
ncbi:MAG: alpha/beta hydrolase, partial [Bacteroidetes bacterium]|nr:alpha/beta hydrolase [Bacteroidota bacterium]